MVMISAWTYAFKKLLQKNYKKKPQGFYEFCAKKSRSRYSSNSWINLNINIDIESTNTLFVLFIKLF